MGVAGVEVSFDASESIDPGGTIESYAWDFGDSTSGAGENPVHTYSEPGIYVVTLTVTDDGSAQDSALTAAHIDATNQSPIAVAGGPYTGVSGDAILFDGTDSSDPDGSFLAQAWDFGDDSTGAGSMPSHVYAEPGNYTVVLLVIDAAVTTVGDVIGAGNEFPVLLVNVFRLCVTGRHHDGCSRHV